MSAVSAAPVSRSVGAHKGTSRRAYGLTKVGWQPEGELDYPQWVEAGRYLGALGRGSQWWIGDWIRYGTKKWGEKYTEAARLTGYDHGSLRNLAWVASQFDLSRRRDKLTWTHHQEIAPLEPAEQDQWLDRAIALKLSSSDLRIELRTLRRAREQVAAAADDVGVSLSGVQRPMANSRTREESSGAEHCDNIVCPNCGQKLLLPGLPHTDPKLAPTTKRLRRARLPVPAVA